VSAAAVTSRTAVLRPADPATLEPLPPVPVTPPERLDGVVAAGRDAQAAWAGRPAGDRALLLRRVSRELLAAADEIAATIVSETGKPVAEAYTSELFVCLDHCAWLARHAARVLRTERLGLRQPHLLHKRAWLRYEPLGVVAVVSPWNFPLGVPFTQVATAVAAGDAVVVKPSELTPATGAWLEELFHRAGAPHGLVQVVQGSGPELGRALVAHHGVSGVVFTGSSAVGREVGQQAAARLVPAVLELGGKDPMLVLGDADLPRAVEGALWAAFTNCGQVCSGVERIYVERPLFEPFVAALSDRASRLRLGHGADPTTDMGPLIAEGQLRRVEGLVADAVEHGAQVAYGARRPDLGLPGWFHAPTVLVGEPAPARIAREEIFGPVVTVVEIDNDTDGIARANASRFGLGASVWTRDRDRGRRVAERLEAGSVWLNDHAYSYGVCQAPWGGRKESGHGRTHSKHGLYAMTQVKFVDSDRGRLSPPWWFPYSEPMVDGFRGALGVLFEGGVVPRARSLAAHRRGAAELLRRTLR
jgi:succinate-semialdehyde dehydrogenase/glutarate-semialdehyde dehydrogenase